MFERKKGKIIVKKIWKIICTKKIELWNRKKHQVMVIGEIFQWKSFDEVSNTVLEKRLCTVDVKSTMVFVHVRREGCRTCWKQVGLVSIKKTNPLVGTTCYREIDEWKRPWKFQDLLRRHILTPFFWKSLLQWLFHR